MAVALDQPVVSASGGQSLSIPFGLVAVGGLGAALWLFVVAPSIGLTPPLAAGFGWPLPEAMSASLVALGLCVCAGAAAVAVMARRYRREMGLVADVDALFQDVAHAGADFIWQADREGRIETISDGFERLSGWPREVAVGCFWGELPGVTIADQLLRAMSMAVARRRPFRDIEITLSVAAGGTCHLRLIGRPFFDDERRLAGYRGAGIDISDVVATRERLAFVDRHDPLTGLLNRQGSLRAVAAILQGSRDASDPPVVLVFDIDRFRGINEAFGAASGDAVVQQVAERIRVCAKEGDLLGRLSGDEFLLLRPHGLPADPLGALTSRLEQTLDERFSVTDETLKVTCHIGVYEITPDDREPETCIRRAQLAVSQARRDRRSTRLFMDGMDLEALSVRRLEEELRHAIADGGLALNYQPQLDLRTGRYGGAEALIRWHHREHGPVSPARFIPLAERTGMVVELSRWALRRACLDSKRLGAFQLAVNLSPIDLLAPDCVEHMESLLTETGMDPGRLELEITEGVLIEDTDTTLDVLLRLRRLGLKIALDDFGTGYAGLGYLQIFPFDKLKIDQSFIRRIVRSRHAASIVRSVVALAHDLDLVVCAEGVETKDQLELLIAEGCDLVQGYFAGQPMSVKRLRQLVGRQTALEDEVAAGPARLPVVGMPTGAGVVGPGLIASTDGSVGVHDG
jgi:diguanylate cyclase (GGDEF)-like protein/PAS domain S-box-containing protein